MGTRSALFAVLLVAFGRAAVFPLSTWLPDPYPTVTAPVTAVFAGLLTKVGVYAIIRAHTLLFPSAGLDKMLMVAAFLTMLVGILGAIAQSDIKRLLSFTLVSHIGYMVFGIALSSRLGLAGAIYYVTHHILVQTTLFLVVGLIERQAGASTLQRLPQGNASTALGVEHHRGVASTYDALVDGVPLAEVVSTCPEVANLDVVPATIDLAGAEIELVSVVARESRLRKAIAAHPLVGIAAEAGEERYDYVLHRLPAVPGPAHAERAGRRRGDDDPDPGGVLRAGGPRPAARDRGDGQGAPEPAARASPRSWSRCTTPAPGWRPAWPTRCASTSATRSLKTTIPRSVRVSEAPSYGQTVMTYDPGSPGALCYLEAAREIATKGAPR